MKRLTFFIGLISFTSLAQQWQTIPHEHYSISRYSGGYFPSFNYSQFEINPFDGSMWFLNNVSLVDFDIKRISYDGTLTVFNPSNTPYMDGNSRYNYGVEFINGVAYILHGFDGVYRCDDLSWSTAAVGVDEGLDICSDGDTIHVARLNQDFMSIRDGVIGFENFNVFRRIRSRNGDVWGAGSSISTIAKYIHSTSSIQTFDPNTCPLLDNSNHDFKFARTSDTLYVAGQQGFSLAYEDQFVDTITMYSSTNMPYSSIIEFEFDSQDNIWAVFGDGGVQEFYPMYIGYYDRTTNNWSMIYDGTNSPIDFTQRLDIEIDLHDNLWVCDRNDLHVLKINSTPSWLSLVEADSESFSIFPNPSNGIVSFQTNAHVSHIEMYDVTGRLIQTMAFSPEIRIEESGTYIIRLMDQETIVGSRKVVIE